MVVWSALDLLRTWNQSSADISPSPSLSALNTVPQVPWPSSSVVQAGRKCLCSDCLLRECYLGIQRATICLPMIKINLVVHLCALFLKFTLYWFKMLSLLDVMLTLSKTSSPQKLFRPSSATNTIRISYIHHIHEGEKPEEINGHHYSQI